MDRYLFWISSGVKVLVLSNTVRARSIILVQYKRKTTITLQLTNAESILAESFLASFSEQTSPISSLAAMVNYCSIKAQLFSGGSTPAETWLMQAVGIRLNSQVCKTGRTAHGWVCSKVRAQWSVLWRFSMGTKPSFLKEMEESFLAFVFLSNKKTHQSNIRNF